MEKFMEKVRSTKIGDSLNDDDVLYGPMLSEKYADFLDASKCANQVGLRVSTERRITTDSSPPGFVAAMLIAEPYMWPHVYVGVTDEMDCFHEEILGLRSRSSAKDFDHALYLANASPHGLSSAIYTNDRLEAYRFKQASKPAWTGINNQLLVLKPTSHSEVSRIWECTVSPVFG